MLFRSLSIISTKTVSFVLDNKLIVPNNLNEFKPILNKNILKLSYDKNKTNLKNIIDILIENEINFSEINTSEGDLEDVFLKVTKGT